jgi:hypothetical protein
MSLSIDDRLAEAARLKDEGNTRFKDGDYKGSITQYKRVFLYTKGVDAVNADIEMYTQSARREQPSAAQTDAAKAIVGAVCSNLGAAYLHVGDPTRAATYCQRVRLAAWDPGTVVVAECGRFAW